MDTNIKPNPTRKKFILVLSVLICLALVFIFYSTSNRHVKIQTREIQTTKTVYESSDSLKQTIIVPTLDSPIEENRNVIWCSSFQLTWNKVKDDIIGEPIEVIGAEDLAKRLNNARQTVNDIEPESLYVAAGLIKDGIIEKINQEMAAKFPSHSLPDFSLIVHTPDGILSYSYLIANVPFEIPFFQIEDEFVFTDSNGIETDVEGFGIWESSEQYEQIRQQVEILYAQEDDTFQVTEFAIDLCKYSQPYQIVAAVVEPKATLQETYQYINQKSAEFKDNPNYELQKKLEDNDTLMVPEMFWEIDHRFEVLIGKTVANVGMPIVEAWQGITFRLDRSGAVLESEALFGIESIPRDFIFNKPFLVYIKKSGCEQPFFVMWVDNAELLNKK